MGEDGKHYYGIDYNSGNESFWALLKIQPSRFLGEITIPAAAFPSSEGLDRYDIVGVIVVGSATSIER
ncbi:MAG: hypothetical protein QXX64_04645 [Nitrososphaera sp.]|uniref:hypothetical protein n=1 Tax=Candidatus Nitrososphaera gargensis TaxID=497727 RepID=UPI0011E50B96|nr:hypothetical protein [Candidatus Nitrososphaera gargensis]